MVSSSSFSLCVVGLISLISVASSTWSYDRSSAYAPEFWYWSYGDCNGTRQSPIDIDTYDVETNNDLTAFVFESYDEIYDVNITLENDGHTAKLYLDGVNLTISDGGLGDTYIFGQLHFHWGENDTFGSEHTIDSEQYPMEMHLVHYRSIYSSVSEAADQEDGLAVLGYFFEISAQNNTDLDELIAGLEEISTWSSNSTVMTFALEDLVLPETSAYYRYNGSLTTPPCYESVIWTVFEKTIKISSEQMSVFRNLVNNEGSAMINNYRPVQNQTVYQTVYYYEEVDDDDAAMATQTSLVAMGMALVMAKVML